MDIAWGRWCPEARAYVVRAQLPQSLKCLSVALSWGEGLGFLGPETAWEWGLLGSGLQQLSAG